MSTDERPAKPGIAPDDAQSALRAAIDRAMERYFSARRGMVEHFVARHLSFVGNLRLHGRALGLDIVRAPVNVVLIAPSIALQLAAFGARRVGARRVAEWLGTRHLFLKTSVGREIEWLLYTELLELPCAQGQRVSQRDALAEEILKDSEIVAALGDAPVVLDLSAGAEHQRRRLRHALATYTGARAPAADIANGIISLGAGAIAFKQLTPGAITLGPAVAGSLVKEQAIEGFPLGAWLGGLWYGLFPPAPSAGLMAATLAELVLAAAVLSAFSGIVTDPLQRALGLHQRRLHRMLDVLERNFRGDADARFMVRDHYVSRILDLSDMARAAARLLP